jgi:hypothetical protein
MADSIVIHVRLPNDIYQQLERRANAEDRPIQQMLKVLLKRSLDKKVARAKRS